MTLQVTTRRMLTLFADLLDYPREVPVESARELSALAREADPLAGSLLDDFTEFVEHATRENLQEVYTHTFDLDATWHPYVGYHLFGETYQRSVFLVELKERYERHSFEVEAELPDHLPVILRFLGVCDDDDLVQEIISEALLPTLDKITSGKTNQDSEEEPSAEVPATEVPAAEVPADSHRAYGALVRALRALLAPFRTNESEETAHEGTPVG